MAVARNRKEVRTMDYNYYFGGEFETFKSSKKGEKKQKKLLKRAKKSLRKFRDKVIDMILSTVSQIAIRYFDKKYEKAFA